MSQAPSRITPELVQPATKGQAKAAPVAAPDPAVVSGAMVPSTAPSELARDRQGPPLRQGKVSLNFRLDPELHHALRVRSHLTDVSIQSIVESAVRRYLGL